MNGREHKLTGYQNPITRVVLDVVFLSSRSFEKFDWKWFSRRLTFWQVPTKLDLLWPSLFDCHTVRRLERTLWQKRNTRVFQCVVYYLTQFELSLMSFGFRMGRSLIEWAPNSIARFVAWKITTKKEAKEMEVFKSSLPVGNCTTWRLAAKPKLSLPVYRFNKPKISSCCSRSSTIVVRVYTCLVPSRLPLSSILSGVCHVSPSKVKQNKKQKRKPKKHAQHPMKMKVSAHVVEIQNRSITKTGGNERTKGTQKKIKRQRKENYKQCEINFSTFFHKNNNLYIAPTTERKAGAKKNQVHDANSRPTLSGPLDKATATHPESAPPTMLFFFHLFFLFFFFFSKELHGKRDRK